MPNDCEGRVLRHTIVLLVLLLTPPGAWAQTPPEAANGAASQPAQPASQPAVAPLATKTAAPVTQPQQQPKTTKESEANDLPRSTTDHLLEKGRMYLALTFGLGSSKSENSALLLEEGTQDANSPNFGILLPFAYQVADMFAVGLELSYEHDNREQVRRVGGNESQLQRFA